jgi:hypothetical protein
MPVCLRSALLSSFSLFSLCLYLADAEVIVNGHDHHYERFAPQNPDGKADVVRGIREFVVGTGDKNHRPFGTTDAHSEVRDAEAFGVLKLTLLPGRYQWQFLLKTEKPSRIPAPTSATDS